MKKDSLWLWSCFILLLDSSVCTKGFPPSNAAIDPILSHHRKTLACTTTTLHNNNNNMRSVVPKQETDVTELWKQDPHADGRGVTIAVLDTGCDLAAAGLQVTSTGSPKYVDFLDCTGDGDVSLKVNATVDKDSDKHTVKGLSGKTLTLPPAAAESLETVRLGLVAVDALLPGKARRRVQQERKHVLQEQQKQAVAKVQRELEELQETDSNSKQAKETSVLLEQLQESMDDYDDGAGPVMDIVAWKDEKGVWRALLDLEATGDLTQATPMAAFGVDRQFGTLGFGSAVTFCLQFYEDGDILSIVTDAGSHGTHVAGIAAGNYLLPDTEEGNETKVTDMKQADFQGVAPGAQVLACKIGDGRVDSTETGTGLVRALIAAKKYGCQLINLSYGEPSFQFDKGRVAKTFDMATHHWGMTVFTSAGNDGPALSTVGSPGSFSAPITVGAHVSPQMMQDQYSTLSPFSTTNENNEQDTDGEATLQSASYSFTSRGPTLDGAFPDVCAPGGAIASVPRHSLQGKSQKHGTSMASPNACGVAACVLSALQKDGIALNPLALKRALRNSAKPVDVADPFGQGNGLVSATGAVEYAKAHAGKVGQDMQFDVYIPSRSNARGIYIREAAELAGPQVFNVGISPRFDHHSTPRTVEECDALLGFEIELDLEGTAAWIQPPSKMTLLSGMENSQSFPLRLDFASLPPGAHTGWVNALDANDRARGPLFQVPVTVLVPQYQANGAEFSPDEDKDASLSYRLLPGAPERRFIQVPTGCEWVKLKLRQKTQDQAGPHRVILHVVPFASTDVHKKIVQTKRFMALKYGVEEVVPVRTRGGSVMELCLQLSWLANPSPVEVEVDLEFHSLEAKSPGMFSSQPLRIPSSTGYARLDIGAPFHTEILNPKATLSTIHRSIRPSKSTITAGSSERDILHPRNADVKNDKNGTLIYQMHLDYSFSLDADISVVPRVSSLFHQLYDSPLDSQLWALYDCNGQVLAHGGAMHDVSAQSLKKGKYSIILLLRHPDTAALKAVKDLPIRLSMNLKDKLDCPVYGEMQEASTPEWKEDGRKTLGKAFLRRGKHKAIYVARPTAKLPDWAQPGDVCMGTFLLDKDQSATAQPLMYDVPPKPLTNGNGESKKKDSKKKEKEDSDEEKLRKAIYEAKLKHLKTMRSKGEKYDALVEELKKEEPKDVALHRELLEYVKEQPKPNTTDVSDEAWRVDLVSSFVEMLTNGSDAVVSETELAQYFGCNQVDPDEDDDEESDAADSAKKMKKEMEDKRKLLRSSLLHMTKAYGDLCAAKYNLTLPTAEDIKSEESVQFGAAAKALQKWASGASDFKDDADKEIYSLAMARVELYTKAKAASSLSILRKSFKDQAADSKLRKQTAEEMIGVYKLLGLEHWADHWEARLQKMYPKAKQTL